jgi:hypothetical protein
MDLVQKSVLIIGQTNVLAHFNRRSQVLSRFLKDQKKASDLLKQNDAVLKVNKTKLFGSAFYKALHRKARGARHSKEIKFHLGPRAGSSFRGRGSGAKPGGSGRGASQGRPFHRGPPHKSQREGQKQGAPKEAFHPERKFGGAKRVRRYVHFSYYKKANSPAVPSWDS